MHSADIQAALKKKGITQRALAIELEVSPFTVSEVINKHRVSHKVMTAISRKIDRQPHKVFPEYYLGPKKRRHGHQLS